MKKFYQKTTGFWILSRFLLILFFIGVTAMLFFKMEMGIEFSLILLPMLAYIFIMAIEFRKEVLAKQSSSLLKFFTGGFSILYGILTVFTIFKFTHLSAFQKAAFFLFPLWLVLFGVGEILVRKTKE